MNPNLHSVWDKVDGILVINLDTSVERLEAFRRSNASTLPMEKVKRQSAVMGRLLPTYGKVPWFTERTMERAPFWGGTAGCAISHRHAIARAKAEGWRNVLILEDDAVAGDNADALKLFEYALDNLKGDYMLYLGYSRPTPYGRSVHAAGEHALWQVEGVLSTYAYLIPQSMYDRLLAIMPTEENVWEWISIHRAVDSFYRDTAAALPGVKVYAIQPDLVEHVDGQSDIGCVVTRTDTYDRVQTPHSYATVAGVFHMLGAPFRRLKVRLNSIRTHRRALRGGLPGFRKRRQKKENESK